MGWEDLFGGSSGWVGHEGDGAELASRQNILAASERDLERKRARDREPMAPMRWRWHGGAWQRWSELDGTFATMAPPASLVAHAAAHGVPPEDEELIFVDGAWKVADDHVGAPDEHAAVEVAPPAATSPVDGRDRAAADFERQLDAWRRRT